MNLSQTALRLLNRRAFLSQTANGLAGIALTSLLQAESARNHAAEPAGTIDPARPSAPRLPHHPPRAKNVIVVFCAGAISHVDTFDFKPELIRRHGQRMP